MATQLQIYALYGSPFAALWMLIFAGLIELNTGASNFFLYYLPFLAIVLFGLYAVYTVISGALSIDDCVDAQRELQKEIDETRKELKKRGIIE
ncbi:Dolichol-phosphate mannosyltransferase subunit 3 [Aphelenchoides bicaudatus]|nr:Dolichol-phosphate mannosyltransferase subunit 3 [Aphelenchoides bicaudatus]